VYTLARSRRARGSEGPRHTANGELQAALSCWDSARNQAATGQRARAGRAYEEGLRHFLWCVNLTWSAGQRSAPMPRPDDLMPVCHAMGAMGREGVPLLERSYAMRSALHHARIALAASHLADPAGGNGPHATFAAATR
jgi:hypothetical protein